MSVLSFFNLSDHYERKARLIPGVLAVVVLLPVAAAVSMPLPHWLSILVGGVGLGAVVAVGLSHLASAMGNRYQRLQWPDWPHDSPTHAWLQPGNTRHSLQHQTQLYEALHNATGLNIAAVVESENQVELTAIINDAVSQVRAKLWKSPEADRLHVHNADYGFARNLTGLRPVWIFNAVLSVAVTWLAYAQLGASIIWPVLASLIAVAAVLFAYLVLPGYVRQRAEQYAESFFAALMSLGSGNPG